MNINESVIIKLNETGMSILRNEHSKLKSALPSLNDFVEIEPDEDGFYQKKMQLWSVMQTFGHYISIGANPPFSTEIDIPGSDEVNKLKAMNKELLAALEDMLKVSVMDVVSSDDFWSAFNKANELLAKAKASS